MAYGRSKSKNFNKNVERTEDAQDFRLWKGNITFPEWGTSESVAGSEFPGKELVPDERRRGETRNIFIDDKGWKSSVRKHFDFIDGKKMDRAFLSAAARCLELSACAEAETGGDTRDKISGSRAVYVGFSESDAGTPSDICIVTSDSDGSLDGGMSVFSTPGVSLVSDSGTTYRIVGGFFEPDRRRHLSDKTTDIDAYPIFRTALVDFTGRMLDTDGMSSKRYIEMKQNRHNWLNSENKFDGMLGFPVEEAETKIPHLNGRYRRGEYRFFLKNTSTPLMELKPERLPENGENELEDVRMQFTVTRTPTLEETRYIGDRIFFEDSERTREILKSFYGSDDLYLRHNLEPLVCFEIEGILRGRSMPAQEGWGGRKENIPEYVKEFLSAPASKKQETETDVPSVVAKARVPFHYVNMNVGVPTGVAKVRIVIPVSWRGRFLSMCMPGTTMDGTFLKNIATAPERLGRGSEGRREIADVMNARGLPSDLAPKLHAAVLENPEKTSVDYNGNLPFASFIGWPEDWVERDKANGTEFVNMFMPRYIKNIPMRGSVDEVAEGFSSMSKDEREAMLALVARERKNERPHFLREMGVYNRHEDVFFEKVFDSETLKDMAADSHMSTTISGSAEILVIPVPEEILSTASKKCRPPFSLWINNLVGIIESEAVSETGTQPGL